MPSLPGEKGANDKENDAVTLIPGKVSFSTPHSINDTNKIPAEYWKAVKERFFYVAYLLIGAYATIAKNRNER